MPSYLLPKNRI